MDHVEPDSLSDHLCWSGVGSRHAHDLLPLREPQGRLLAAMAAGDPAAVADGVGPLLARWCEDGVVAARLPAIPLEVLVCCWLAVAGPGRNGLGHLGWGRLRGKRPPATPAGRRPA